MQTAVDAIALCHNVTPIFEHGKTSYQAASPDEVRAFFSSCSPSRLLMTTTCCYVFPFFLTTLSLSLYRFSLQVALVKWTETVGVCLDSRDLHSMRLQLADGTTRSFHILHIFPFTSETKRMGIIVKVREVYKSL